MAILLRPCATPSLRSTIVLETSRLYSYWVMEEMMYAFLLALARCRSEVLPPLLTVLRVTYLDASNVIATARQSKY